MSDNVIKVKAVSELLDKHFFIPDYQRGYRWTEQQVKDLLNDLWDFAGSDHKNYQFYCLQPLVVRKMTNEEKTSNKLDLDNEWYEVIDGQQRLITIYLILSATKAAIQANGLPEELYEIRFHRESDPAFLQFMTSENNYDASTIDRYHISLALKTIRKWFTDIKKGAAGKVSFVLLSGPDWVEFDEKVRRDKANNVRFIWYESVDEDPIKVFTRLNIGKISLTNSELIKAVFLNRSNFVKKEGSSDKEEMQTIEGIRLKQQEIASEWDIIEYTLQDDEFWLFLHDKNYERPTRIDFIFELICEKEWSKLTDDERRAIGTDDYKTFRFFYNRFQSKKYTIKSCWEMVQKYFYTFKEWYNDLKLYHYVGYLIACNDDQSTGIAWLMTQWDTAQDKDAFVEILKKEILKKIDAIGVDRQYNEDGSNKALCKPILLFHNIQTIVSRNEAQVKNKKYHLGTFYKFPFHLFKLEGWDVEHINSSTTNSEADIKTQKEWLCNVYLSVGEETQRHIQELFNSGEEKFIKDFDSLKEECLKTIYKGVSREEEWTPSEKNQISNYTLLDSSTNRSYGNAIFSGKRRVIISKENGELLPLPKLTRDGRLVINEDDKRSATSSFVPPCTKQVFLKYYSSTIGNNNYWSKYDAQSYKEDIMRCIDKLRKK